MSKKLYECSVDELVNEVFGENENETHEKKTHIEDKPKMKKWSETTHEERNKIFEEYQDIDENQFDIGTVFWVIVVTLIVIFLHGILKIW